MIGSAQRRLHSERDWMDFEEVQQPCTNCTKPVRIYWDPDEGRFLLLGFHCPHCTTPYTDLFTTAKFN